MFELLTQAEKLELREAREDLTGHVKAQRRKDARAIFRHRQYVHQGRGVLLKFTEAEWAIIKSIAEGKNV